MTIMPNTPVTDFAGQDVSPARKGAVLFVDDDAEILEELGGALESSGVEVLSANDAFSALSVLRASSVDVLVTDVRMPEMDGLTLARIVRDEFGVRAPQLVFISGAATADMVADALRSDAVDFIFKPFGPEDIARAVGRALARAATLRHEILRFRRADRSGQTAVEDAPRSASPAESSPLQDPSALLRHTLERMSAERQARQRFFDEEVCTGPAWSILVELAHMMMLDKTAYVSSVALGSGIPLTTALRYIDMLVSRKLVEREPDPADRRRVTLRLSDSGSELMRSYIQDIAKLAS